MFNLMNDKKQNNELSFFICLTDKDYKDIIGYIGKTVGVVGILELVEAKISTIWIIICLYPLPLNIFDLKIPLLEIYPKEIIGQAHKDVAIGMILKHCL